MPVYNSEEEVIGMITYADIFGMTRITLLYLTCAKGIWKTYVGQNVLKRLLKSSQMKNFVKNVNIVT